MASVPGTPAQTGFDALMKQKDSEIAQLKKENERLHELLSRVESSLSELDILRDEYSADFTSESDESNGVPRSAAVKRLLDKYSKI